MTDDRKNWLQSADGKETIRERRPSDEPALPTAERENEVHKDPYPSRIAMEAAVELEIHAALGRVQTQTVGKVIQRAIDKALAADAASPATETLALWMMGHGYATGHGDTIEDMLAELGAQIKEQAASPASGGEWPSNSTLATFLADLADLNEAPENYQTQAACILGFIKSEMRYPSASPSPSVTEEEIRNAVALGNKSYWHGTREQEAAFKEWKAGGFTGDCPQRSGGSIVDHITREVLAIIRGERRD
jgi:hypothetical protein